MIKYRALLWLLVIFIPQEGDPVVCDYVDCAICEKNRAFAAIESADTILVAQFTPPSGNVLDDQKAKIAHFSVREVLWGNRVHFAPDTNLTLQSLCAEVNQCQLFLLVGHSGDRRVWHEPVLLNSEEVPRIASLVSLIRGTNLNQKVIDDMFNLIHTATPDVASEAVAAVMKRDVGVWNSHRNMLPQKGLRTVCEDKVLESPSDAVLLMLLALCHDSRDLALVQDAAAVRPDKP